MSRLSNTRRTEYERSARTGGRKVKRLCTDTSLCMAEALRNDVGDEVLDQTSSFLDTKKLYRARMFSGMLTSY